MLELVEFYLKAALLLAPLLACVGIGVLWGKRDRTFRGDFVTTLVTSICSPALVFYTFTTTQLDDQALADIAGITLLALLLVALICMALLSVLRLPVRKLLPIAFLPNAGNLGLPVALLVFGDEGLSIAVAFFAINSFVMHTLAVRLLCSERKQGRWKSPVLIMAVLAVGLRLLNIPVPDWLVETARMLGVMTVPLMLLSLGHALALIPYSGVRSGAVVGIMRLTVGLGVGYGVAWVLGLPPVMAGTLTLQMAMPCAVGSYMYTRRYTDMGDTAAGAVLVSSASFLLLAPALVWLVKS